MQEEQEPLQKTQETESKGKILLELFFLSFLSLFVELLIIRWMSADIRAFTVFHTFPLITCFVGLGVGFALPKDNIYKNSLPAILLFAIFMKAANFTGICFWGFPSLGIFQWQNLVGLASDPGWAYLFVFAMLIILLLAGPFAICVCIGSRLGYLFNKLSPLTAYCYNVGGAIAGSIAFPIACYQGIPPQYLLIAVATALTICSFRQKNLKLSFSNLLILGLLFPLFACLPEQTSKPLIPELLASEAKHSVLWSPYQRIDLTTFYDRTAKDAPVFLGLELSANRAFYQYYFSSNAFEAKTIAGLDLPETIKRDYALPYKLNSPDSVLIVGAGTGQNVSSALAAGLSKIDAVEIDPLILKIGKEFNSAYGSEKVQAICDDARHYFSNCKEKYDLVNFATLDSHAVAGLGSSVRLDAYVYTKESIKQAMSLLKPDGYLVCSFVTIEPWIEKRLVNTFSKAAGYPPLVTNGATLGRVFILGEGVKNKTLKLPDGYESRPPALGGSDMLKDDWPYLYVRTDVVDWTYLLVVSELVLLSVYASRRFLFSSNDALSWQMFFLGSAFIILELHAISFLSLLYGSTWITSAIVINGILFMILAANAFVIKCGAWTRLHPRILYAALLAAITLSYINASLPQRDLGPIAATTTTLVTLLPMGIAAVIFATAISKAENLSKQLAFNLFGAVLGGLLEYISNYTGIKSLLILSAFLYAISFYCLTKRKINFSSEAN